MSPARADPQQDSTSFEYSCACSNVHITAKAAASSFPSTSTDVQAGSSEISIWLDQDSEHIKQARYVTWDREDSRPSRRKSLAPDQQEPAERSWRKCWICNISLYQSEGKEQASPAAIDEWVTIDLLGGILWGDQLDKASQSTSLPFTTLRLDIHPYISKFGKPPPSPLTVYHPRSTLPGEENRYIRPPADPFFLPPPFIPSHPHLRELCTRAIDFLRERHSIKEYQIQSFIAQQEQEMRNLEDTVRNEVEALWNRFTHVPGVAAELDRSRSRSTTRDGEDKRRQSVSKFSPSPVGESTPTQTPDPIKSSVPTSPTPGGSSLLSASINANTFHAPPPPRVSDKVDDSILELSKTTDKNSDARAVAMSHVFSVLDDHMARGKRKTTSKEEPKKAKEDSDRLDQIAEGSDTQGQDSWIEGEKAVAKEAGKTPRPSHREVETKEKRAVKFVDAEESTRDDEDYVFDFELDEKGPKSPPTRDISRTRNDYEASLSRTYAADAPSHRHGWKRLVRDGSLHAPMRRTSTDSIGEDESNISKLAMSMPMEIALKAQRKPSVLPPMERKTSWSDRAEFVPPLLTAMRQRGIEPQNSLGLSPARPTRDEMPRKTSRSASVSRERDQARTYSQDPGAVFESLADAVEDDEEEDQEGTFVPPHVLAGRSSQDGGPEVGWRSLAPT